MNFVTVNTATLRHFGILAVLALLSLVGAASSVQADEALPEPVHGISAFGALKYEADFKHFDYVNPDAPKGGELSMRPTIANRTFDSFNPFILKGDAAAGTHEFYYDTLMVRAYDEPDALYGLVAASVQMPPDRAWVIFNLRPEARFADGSPLTAEDVAFSLNALKTGDNPRFAVALAQVAHIEPLAPHRLKVSFAEGAPTRDLPAVVAQMPIFSKAYYSTRPFSEPSIEPPLNSGPYAVESFEAGRTIIYRRRTDYWAKDLPVMVGQFNFDRLRYEYILDSEAALEAFKARIFDLNEEYLSKKWATEYTFPAVTNGWVRRETIPDGSPSGTQGAFINTRRAHLSDHRVRAALGMMFDFEWTNQRLFHNLYTRTDSFFENTDLQAEGMPSPQELALLEPFRAQLPEAVFGEAVSPTTTNGDGRIRRQQRAAGKLLDAAGWTVKDGRRVNARGEALEIEFLDRAGSASGRIIDPFIQNLASIGVTAMQRQVDPAQYELRVKNFDFDVVTARFPLPVTPGPTLRGYLASSVADQPGSYNLSGIKSPAIDAMLDAMAAAKTRDELRVAARALDRIFRAEHYWWPQWYRPFYPVAWWDVFARPQDLGLSQPEYDRAIIRTWWYDPQKAAALQEKMSR
ncbi:MAG: extracellular solute-binding protein [Neomegalonema sp.]|nr:extracellular solute-binding protein [Neomegalonema sp.]